MHDVELSGLFLPVQVTQGNSAALVLSFAAPRAPCFWCGLAPESQKCFIGVDIDLKHENFQAALHVSSHMQDAKDSSGCLSTLGWHVVSGTPGTSLTDSYWFFYCLTRTSLIQAMRLLLAS